MKTLPLYILLYMLPFAGFAQNGLLTGSADNNEKPVVQPLQILPASVTIKDSLLPIQSFSRKAFRSAKLILAGEVATMVFFYVMPEDFSNWNRNFYEAPVPHWKRAFTMPPKWDNDPNVVNYVQHPLAGAIYYNGVRSQGATRLQSFLFSVAESTFFEYFIESVAERPSTQDLIVTPLAGSLIGEMENMLTLRMKRRGFSFAEKVAVTIINPMYVVFNGYKNPAYSSRVTY